MNNEYITFDDEMNNDIGLIYTKDHNRLGEVNYNKWGSKLTIIGYRHCDDIDVLIEGKFSTGENWQIVKHHTWYGSFKHGQIQSPYDCTCSGVGYLGIGKYTPKEYPIFYSHWKSMLARCYGNRDDDEVYRRRGCFVNKSFHNFQNFCYWCENNYYTVKNEKMCLDKDIIVSNNVEYSPTTCIFVPEKINLFFLSKRSDNTSGYTGIKMRGDKYIMEYSSINGYEYSVHSSLQEAINSHDNIKRSKLNDLIQEYKNYLPEYVYNILMNRLTSYPYPHQV